MLRLADSVSLSPLWRYRLSVPSLEDGPGCLGVIGSDPPQKGAGSPQRPPKRGGRCCGYSAGRSLLIYPSGKGGEPANPKGIKPHGNLAAPVSRPFSAQQRVPLGFPRTLFRRQRPHAVLPGRLLRVAGVAERLPVGEIPRVAAVLKRDDMVGFQSAGEPADLAPPPASILHEPCPALDLAPRETPVIPAHTTPANRQPT